MNSSLMKINLNIFPSYREHQYSMSFLRKKEITALSSGILQEGEKENNYFLSLLPETSKDLELNLKKDEFKAFCYFFHLMHLQSPIIRHSFEDQPEKIELHFSSFSLIAKRRQCHLFFTYFTCIFTTSGNEPYPFVFRDHIADHFYKELGIAKMSFNEDEIKEFLTKKQNNSQVILNDYFTTLENF